jgi:hypothetical protein
MALAGSEEQAIWEGSASVEHHFCSVSDGSRVQNCVGRHVKIACRICSSGGCPPFAREIVCSFLELQNRGQQLERRLRRSHTRETADVDPVTAAPCKPTDISRCAAYLTRLV